MLDVSFAVRIVILQVDLSVKRGSLLRPFDLDKNKSTNSIDSISMNLYFRREAWLHFGHGPVISYCLFSILLDLVWIRGSKYFNSSNIVWLNIKINIACWWEKAKIESFKYILLDVLLIDRTKIVEPFDLFECLTSWGLKISWNTNDRSVNVVLISSLLNNRSLLRNAFITNISEHDNSVLTFIAFVWFDPFLEKLVRFSKAIYNGSSSTWSDLVKSLIDLRAKIFF